MVKSAGKQVRSPGRANRAEVGGRGAARVVLRLAGAALATVLVVMLAWWALPDQAVLAPLWTQALGWSTALLWRSDPIQRLLGAGRLDNRVWLRVLTGGTIFAATVAPTGLSFLFPVFAALVASVHLQWSGARAWRACMVMTLLLTAVLQVLVHTGQLATTLPAGLTAVATAVTLALSLSLIANIAVLAARREADGAALEVERRARHEQLLHAATHDVLTGQLNRSGLYEHLAREVSRAPVGVAVIYIDLDHFKPVNDQYGHAAGDHLLRLVALRLAALLRPGDRLARLGGDEFVVVLTTADATVVQAVASRAAAALQYPFSLDRAVVHISASIGTALNERRSTVDELLQRADAAMYADKARYRHPGHSPGTTPQAPAPSEGW